MPIYAQPGDIGVSVGRERFSKAIKWWKRDQPGKATHAFVVGREGYLWPTGSQVGASIIESRISKGVREVLFADLYSPFDDVAIFRPLNMRESDINKCLQCVRSHIGDEYGLGSIFMHLIGLEGLIPDSWDRVCSNLIGHCWQKNGWSFGVSGNAAAPNDIEVFCRYMTSLYHPVLPPKWDLL